jgi:WD40 repeat protein
MEKPGDRIGRYRLLEEIGHGGCGAVYMAEQENGASSRRLLQMKQRIQLVRGDLDWIVMKCLEKDRARRYETANGLATDIERHLKNEPVLARPPSRVYEFQKTVRRHKFGFAATVAVIAALGVGIVATSLQAVRARRAEREQARLLRQAQAARQDATEKLWSSYLAEARALRMSGQAGRQLDSLAALGKAAAIRPTLALRNEAIASMVLPDMKWKGDKNFASERGITLDARFENYATCDRAGVVKICRMSDDHELSRLPLVGAGATVFDAFSPDGKWLAVTYADNHMRVWDWATQTQAIEVSKCKEGLLRFTPDSQRLAISDCTNLVMYELTGGKFRTISLTGSEGTPLKPGDFGFDPAGRRLVIVDVERQTNMLIMDTDSGKVLQALPHPDGFFRWAWHPDGRRLATTGADSFVRIWDTTTGKRLKSFQVDQAVGLAFNHEGNLLATSGWDGRIRLFDFPSARQQVSIYTSADIFGFSPDDRTLASVGSTLRLFEMAPSHGLRIVRERAEGTSPPGGEIVFDGHGRFLAYQVPEGVRVWDCQNRRDVSFVAAADTEPAEPVGFDPGNENLLICGSEGLLRYPITEVSPAAVVLGAPVVVLRVNRPLGFTSGDGKLCAITAQNRWRILRTDTFAEVARTGAQPGTVFAAFSPDGKLLATGAFKFPGVKVWNTQTGDLAKDLPVNGDVKEDSATVAFSPEGTLVTATRFEYCFWNVRDWSLVRRVPQETGNDYPAKMAFSRDGRIFAGIHSRNVVRLHDAATGEVLADLEAPYSKFITSLAFNADGTQLVAGESRDALRAWNLRLIRQKLVELGLDWEQPTLPADQSGQPAQKAVTAHAATLLSSPQR